ncbi:BadF/BadG/BcrA/BcrD ATPase family protein [Paenibacillus sp. GCM10027626]|uniref:BadF/BadG/BcrA/BcrD ATPase family protein n=1 Tax=Paenibacillus sp. GCM10027626 TaxID=3273411 RepID=UPI00362A1B07
MGQRCVLGIDGGGSNTRIMVTDLYGNVLAYAEHGAASIRKDANAVSNVRAGIADALAKAGRSPEQVAGLLAGVAGLASDQDLVWVEELTAVPGLTCPRWHVNDAVVAHAGAFMSKPGIMLISGTGSIVFAVTEDGSQHFNDDMHHYASSAARFLAYEATYEILAGHTRASDAELVRQILEYWKAGDMRELLHLALQGFVADPQERNLRFGRMAPIVTSAAAKGSELARSVCNLKIHEAVVGVHMLGACFSSDSIQVACIGSVINSPYMKERFREECESATDKQYTIMEPVLSPVAGAVLMALEKVGVSARDEIVVNLLKHVKSAG